MRRQHLAQITITVIPPGCQRYTTIGDWTVTEKDGNAFIQIYVSAMNNWRHEALVGLHEAVEAVLCLYMGTDQQEIDDFDKAFEASGSEGEPGDQWDAPYYHEHQIATGIERILAAELGVSWQAYEEDCTAAHAKEKK